MAACELGSETSTAVAQLSGADHLSVLLGAGASVAAGLPSWDELAVRMLRSAGAIDDAGTARAYLLGQDPTLAAEAARASAADWSQVVREAMYGPDDARFYPGPLHLAVAGLAATRERGTSTLVTLNLDDLLEEALRDALAELGRDEGVVSRTAAAPRAGGNDHEIQNLHGLLPRASLTASGLVLTLSDFNALGAVAHPWQAAALGEAMSKGPLVLAGTSFRDVDIRQWLHAIATQQRPHGAPVLALVAREGLGLSRRQFADVADAMRRQWAAVGIEALLVQDHSESAQLLREIPAAGLVDYSVPQDRAARLWREHVEEFTERQASHSALLEFDRQNLPTQSGHDTDLTLWLADGSSELTRWSSHDRLYRTPENLRRVPLGHDSPWTAARAISRNEVLVEAAAPPPTGSRRWRTIVAGPLTATLPGGPNLVVGALSAATTADIGEDEEEWRTAIADLVEVWGDRVAGTAR